MDSEGYFSFCLFLNSFVQPEGYVGGEKGYCVVPPQVFAHNY